MARGTRNVYLFDKGPIEKLPFNFRMVEFAPSIKRHVWTYATCCMSQFDDADPIELYIFRYERCLYY